MGPEIGQMVSEGPTPETMVEAATLLRMSSGLLRDTALPTISTDGEGGKPIRFTWCFARNAQRPPWSFGTLRPVRPLRVLRSAARGAAHDPRPAAKAALRWVMRRPSRRPTDDQFLK